jgi:outer membrane receptor for ferrienterochelin and colicin
MLNNLIAERFLKIVFITSLLLISISFQKSELFAQQKKVNLSGVVKEVSSGETIIGANILLYRDSLRQTEMVRGTASNRFGFYSIPQLDAGKYFMFVSCVGYENKMIEINLSESQATPRFDITLISSAYKLQDVIVEGKKRTDFSSTTSTIDVDPALVQTLPSIGGETDIFRALQLLPGVTAATEISSGLYVRGGSPDQNLTLVDGVVVYNPSHLGGFASTFNSDVLKDIKLIKGGFPAEYGGRLSSVLDITMREGTKEKFMGSASLNTISTRATIEGPLDTSSTFIISGRAMYLDKILPITSKFNNIPRYNFFDLNGKVNYVISDKDRVFFSGFLSQDNIVEAPNSQDVGFDISWRNATVNLSWTSFSSSTLFNNTALMFTNYRFYTLIKDKNPTNISFDYFTDSDLYDFLLRRETQAFVGEEHTLKFGAEAIYHNFNTTTSDFFIEELKYRPNYGDKISGFELSLYAQDEWLIFSNLRTNSGVRLYYFPNGKLFAFEPRLSFTYYLLDRFILRGAFAVANQALHMLNRHDIYLPTDVWYPSTRNIKPTKSVQGSFGFEATSPERTYLLSIEAYYKNMKNLYEFRNNSDFSFEADLEDQLTIGRGESYGFELFFNKRIGTVTGWIGYTLGWTKRYFEELNTGEPFYPRYDRRHDISVVLSWNIDPSLSFGATWVYGTGQAYFLPVGQYQIGGLLNPNDNTSSVYYENSKRDAFRLPPFHKLDLSLKYKLKISDSDLELTANVYNVYNRFNIFSKYVGYKTDPVNGKKYPVLKQFTLFPFLPTIGINFKF